MREVWASVREFGRKIIRRWYFVVIGVAGAILGTVDAVAAAVAKPGTAPFVVPLWVWLSMLAGGFLVAIIWAFHDVRMERDAIRQETERRFSAMRYALRRGALDYNIGLWPDGGACNVQVGLNLANESGEHLRYEMKHIAVVIEGRAIEDPQFYNRGTVIAPHGTDKFWYPFVEGVPVGWQTGSVEFTVQWGHPSDRFRYQRSQKLKMRTSRLVGVAPPHDIHIDSDLVDESEVEDI